MVEVSSQVRQDEAFKTYSEQCSGAGFKLLSIQLFCKLIKSTFSQSTRVTVKKKDFKRFRTFKDLTFNTQKECETLIECIKSETNVLLASKDTAKYPIVANMICSDEIDHRPVVKRIEFFKTHFELFVDGTPIDLAKMDIDKNLKQEQHHAILTLVSSLQVCKGYSKTDSNTFHVRNHGDFEAYHSFSCQVVCSLLSRKGRCDSCKKAFANMELRAKQQNDEENDQDAEVKDYDEVIEEMFKDGSSELRDFIKAQRNALGHVKKWDAKIISVCINMYVRSPRSYRDLKDSNMIILPTGRTLARYKNSIKQASGILDSMFIWMKQTAIKAKLPRNGYYGYLVLDEMKVQEDVVLKRSGSQIKVVGFVETTETLQAFDQRRRGSTQRELASNALQFVFLGMTGFRFPIAHYATSTAKASEIYEYTHSIAHKLDSFGFTTCAYIMDGGAQNRDFMRMHFVENPVKCNWMIKAPWNPLHSIALVQDVSHDLKKIRNSLLKSGTCSWHTRRVKINEQFVFWNHLVKAVQWDRMNNCRPLSYKITDHHLFPNQSEKMRNHLADQMLDKDMLNIVKHYQQTLPNPESLNGLVTLLDVTSKIVYIFRDEKPISTVDDNKMTHAKNASYFSANGIRQASPRHPNCLESVWMI